jgi:hypothetical protein
MNLADIWRQLSEGDGRWSSPGLLVRRIDPESAADLFAGLRTLPETRFLLLRLPVEPRLPRNALIQSRGFRTTLTRFDGDPPGSASLMIEAADPSFNDLFGIFAGEVIESGMKRSSEEPLLSAILVCLQRWKRFFDSTGTDGLGDDALLGLLAELFFLSNFAFPHAPTILAAVSAWVGPEPLSKDFQFPGCSIEVKCSAMREHTKVHISGERQLDHRGHATLFLFVLLVEQVGTGGTTVPAFVEAIRARLGEGVAKTVFEDKLIASGYHDAHRLKYADKNFLIKSHRLFHVTETFPKLISPLPNGVGDLSYTVALSACQHFVATDNELMAAMTNLSPPHDA